MSPNRIVLTLFLALAPGGVLAQGFQQPAAFRFTTDDFWLNLHQFLFVLGRAHMHAPDSTRPAVEIADADEERGLKSMNAEEAATWRRAVEWYASGTSSLDPVSDETLIAAALDLAAAGSTPTLIPTTRIDPGTRGALESAAPLYRKTFWPIHLAANQRAQSALEGLLRAYQRPIQLTITHAYGVAWPRSGSPVHICAYTNSTGAFSTRGGLILISSAASDMRGSLALETLFREFMRQWDDFMLRRLQSAASTKRVAVDEELVQALSTYTAGEAVRRAIPGHVPFAEKNGLWIGGQEKFKRALDAAWRPLLDSQVESEVAMADLVSRAAGSPPPPAPRKRP